MKVTVWVVLAGTVTDCETWMNGEVPPGAVIATATMPVWLVVPWLVTSAFTVSAELLRSEAGGDARVEIYSSPRGSLLRTSSGKLRRRPMWAALVGDELQATRLAERPAAGDPVLVGERA